MSTNNLRVGATHDFTGYFEETKKIALPILDKNEQPVSLLGSTITMKHKPAGQSYVDATARSWPDAVLISKDTNKLVLDLTSFINKRVDYEIKIVLADTTVFVIDGVIDITDRL